MTLLAAHGHAFGAVLPKARFVPGEFIVRFDPEVNRSNAQRILNREDASLIHPIPVSHSYLVRSHGQSRGLKATLETRPDVKYVDRNLIFQPTTMPNCPGSSEDLDGIFPVPTDEYWACEWGLHNEQQPLDFLPSAAVDDVDVDAPEAWSIAHFDESESDNEPVVALLDDGVDFSNPDLYEATLWTDDYDFVDGDVSAMEEDNLDPEVYDGHGTAMAGIIAAKADSTGVRGTAAGVQVLPIRVLGENRSTLDATLDGIDYGVTEGATVFNMSFRAAGGTDDYPQSLEDEIDAAPDDTVFVASASEGVDPPLDLTQEGYNIWPCEINDPKVVCVGALDPDGTLTARTDYGLGVVDVVAPGSTIATTVWDPSDPSLHWGGITGTSAATAFVSGIAALRQFHEPTESGAETVARIRDSAVVTPELSPYVATGAVNALRALSDSEVGYSSNTATLSTEGGAPNDVQVEAGTAGSIVLRDTSSHVIPTLDCPPSAFDTTYCPSATTAVVVNGGDSRDTLRTGSLPGVGVTLNGDGGYDELHGSSASETLNGGVGSDEITGNAGADTIAGGDDADTIYAVDGAADTVDCGAGDDIAWVDPGSTDSLTGCERVRRPGSLDASFAGDGIITWSVNQSVGYDVAVQDDGKIVVVGRATFNCCGSPDALVARFNTDGSPDTSFSDGDGTDGYQWFEQAAQTSSAFTRVVIDDATGDIYAAGNYSKTAMVRKLDSNGDVVSSFGTNGEFATSWNRAYNSPGIGDLDLTHDANGDPQLLLSATTEDREWVNDHYAYPYTKARLVRLDGNGDPVTAFSSDGVLDISASPDACSAATSSEFAADGSIWLAGESCAARDSEGWSSGWQMFIAKLEPDGDLDTTFNSTGIRDDSTGVHGPQIALAADGGLIVAGVEYSLGDPLERISHYEPDGDLDTSLGLGGALSFPPEAGWKMWAVNEITRLPGGGYAVAGQARSANGEIDIVISIHDSSGALDSRFSSDGIERVDLSGGSDTGGIAPAPDGLLVSGGAIDGELGIIRHHSIP